MSKLNFINIKSICSIKVLVERMRGQATDEKKHLQTTYPTVDYYLERIENAQNSTVKKTQSN